MWPNNPGIKLVETNFKLTEKWKTYGLCPYYPHNLQLDHFTLLSFKGRQRNVPIFSGVFLAVAVVVASVLYLTRRRRPGRQDTIASIGKKLTLYMRFFFWSIISLPYSAKQQHEMIQGLMENLNTFSRWIESRLQQTAKWPHDHENPIRLPLAVFRF